MKMSPITPLLNFGNAGAAVRFVSAGRFELLGDSLIRRSIEFALAAHRGQLRASGEPFIMHPLSVAQILAVDGESAATVAAGVAHDVLEDTDVTSRELIAALGPDVAAIVNLMTKPTPDDEPPIIALAPHIVTDSDSIVLCALSAKFADRTHNLATIGALPRWRQVRMARETLEILYPAASRVGHRRSEPLRQMALRVLEGESIQAAA